MVFSSWKYALLIVVFILSVIYTLPNIYGEDPSVQIIAMKGEIINESDIEQIINQLKSKRISYQSIDRVSSQEILFRFYNIQEQMEAHEQINVILDKNYSVALNLAPRTPYWLSILGATPIKLGLDLRGGVRFLMKIDVNNNLSQSLDGYYSDIKTALREQKINYSTINHAKDKIIIHFLQSNSLNTASNYIKSHFPDLEVIQGPRDNQLLNLNVHLSQKMITEFYNYNIEQTLTTLRNRINELGITESVVQRQGVNRIIVELPGIQDTAKAKDILGKTATINFVMVDDEHNILKAIKGKIPAGSQIVFDKDKRPVLVKKQVILTGDTIVNASSEFNDIDGRPVVNIRLGGYGLKEFSHITKQNVGKHMAVIYRETRIEDTLVNNKIVPNPKIIKKIISIGKIFSSLGANFQITGLKMEEARDLAILLRSGTLSTDLSIVEERVIGPSLGKENIQRGIIAVFAGLILVLVFMALHYNIFGLFADLALIFNLVLLLAVMSCIGVTLTLPGIAGVILTLGMAVDVNVLIFERIREEIRANVSPNACIHFGFECAFPTIVDANITTLIVGIILFTLGTDFIKGFAVTLSIGVLTSMFTAIMATRALINFFYVNNNKSKNIQIGI